MAVGKEFTLEGVKELDKVLRELPIVMQKRVVNHAVREGAKIIKDKAVELVPVDEGILKRDLFVKKLARTNGVYLVGVRQPTSRRFHLTEFGTVDTEAKPFLRPAFDNSSDQVVSMIVSKMHLGLLRESKKLAGKFSKSGLG